MSVRLNYETCETCAKKKTCPVRVPGGCGLFQADDVSDSSQAACSVCQHPKTYAKDGHLYCTMCNKDVIGTGITND